MLRPFEGVALAALMGVVCLATEGSARAADAPPAATTAATTAAPAAPAAPATPPPAAGARGGAVVIAASDDATPAARALAFDLYREAGLRPNIDDATARVLIGEAPASSASAKVKDLAEVRASLPKAGSDAASRHLLASIGKDLGAEVVVVVSLDGARPVARVLRPGASAFERIELGSTIETDDKGARTVRWPGAGAVVRGLLLPKALPKAATKPLVAAPPPKPIEPRPLWKSPWFWGAVGGVAAVGVTVFVLSRTTSDPGTVRLTGRVPE
jgi:hypothetical protein